MFTALTSAGSDSGGGAGLQADLKTFTVLGVYGLSVVTAVTAQNTTGVQGIHLLPADFIQKQIDSVAADFPINAFKTGLLGSAAIIGAVAASIQKNSLDNYVCDPVVYTKTGTQLLDPSAIHAYRKELLPLASIVTPNRAEAAMLANMDLDELNTMAGAKRAAEKILRTGARSVVIKGLNPENDGRELITDLFYDGEAFLEYSAKRLSTKNTHGSGCVFAAVITALLAEGVELHMAVDNARSFISQAIQHHVKIGGGVRPVNPMALTPQ